MTDVDPRLVNALREQLARQPMGAARVGWKFGSGENERFGDDHVVGHLTSATTLADGSTYRGGGNDLHADVEVAVELGDGRQPARYGIALEICDLAGHETLEDVVAGNDYHRAVTFGPFVESLPAGLEGALVMNGERRASGSAPDDVGERAAAVGRALGAVGEALQPGDRIITGLIVNAAVAPGDDVVAELGALGRVGLRIA